MRLVTGLMKDRFSNRVPGRNRVRIEVGSDKQLEEVMREMD